MALPLFCQSLADWEMRSGRNAKAVLSSHDENLAGLSSMFSIFHNYHATPILLYQLSQVFPPKPLKENTGISECVFMFFRLSLGSKRNNTIDKSNIEDRILR
jgi:hypothetical protein